MSRRKRGRLYEDLWNWAAPALAQMAARAIWREYWRRRPPQGLAAWLPPHGSPPVFGGFERRWTHGTPLD